MANAKNPVTPEEIQLKALLVGELVVLLGVPRMAQAERELGVSSGILIQVQKHIGAQPYLADEPLLEAAKTFGKHRCPKEVLVLAPPRRRRKLRAQVEAIYEAAPAADRRYFELAENLPLVDADILDITDRVMALIDARGVLELARRMSAPRSMLTNARGMLGKYISVPALERLVERELGNRFPIDELARTVIPSMRYYAYRRLESLVASMDMSGIDQAFAERQRLHSLQERVDAKQLRARMRELSGVTSDRALAEKLGVHKDVLSKATVKPEKHVLPDSVILTAARMFAGKIQPEHLLVFAWPNRRVHLKPLVEAACAEAAAPTKAPAKKKAAKKKTAKPKPRPKPKTLMQAAEEAYAAGTLEAVFERDPKARRAVFDKMCQAPLALEDSYGEKGSGIIKSPRRLALLIPYSPKQVTDVASNTAEGFTCIVVMQLRELMRERGVELSTEDCLQLCEVDHIGFMLAMLEDRPVVKGDLRVSLFKVSQRVLEGLPKIVTSAASHSSPERVLSSARFFKNWSLRTLALMAAPSERVELFLELARRYPERLGY